jgi:hypothetical protein
MKTPDIADQERRRIRLARLSKTLEEFIYGCQKFPRHYGYPGMGSKMDYERFYYQIKDGIKVAV